MNILVLAGGLSPERDVSLITGANVKKALRRRGHNAVLADLFFGYGRPYADPSAVFKGPDEDIDSVITENVPDIGALLEASGGRLIGDDVLPLCKAADIVFMALHGADGENGKLQALFDMLCVKYTGSDYLGSALAMNKELSKKLFLQSGVPTADYCVIKKGTPLPDMLPFPFVIKPCCGGSSVGVSIVRRHEDLAGALELAFASEDTLVAESYIEGREFSAGILGGKALPIIEVCPKSGFYDYANKYQSGRTVELCPAPLNKPASEEMQSAALRAYEALRLSVYGRMDFRMDGEGRIFCLEANTLPGMTPLSLIPQEAAAAGIPYDDLCEEIIRLSLERYK